MITNIFQYALNIETTAFCGRLTSIELEGVGLALSVTTELINYIIENFLI